jgi:Xaa-Pro dipeptidase
MAERMYTSRVQALKRLERANGVECVALVPGANFRYFTGLTNQLTERPAVAFIPAQGELAFLLPELEVPAAKAHLPANARLFTYRDEEGHELAFIRVAEALALAGKPIGVEYLAMRMLEMRRIQGTAEGCQLLATEPWLPQLRMRKGEPSTKVRVMSER